MYSVVPPHCIFLRFSCYKYHLQSFCVCSFVPEVRGSGSESGWERPRRQSRSAPVACDPVHKHTQSLTSVIESLFHTNGNEWRGFFTLFFSFIKICKKKKKRLVMIYVSLKGTSHSLFRRSSCNMFGSQLWFTEPLPWKALPPIQGVSFQVQTRASWQPGPGRPRGIAVSLPGCPCAGAHPHLPAFNFLRLWWWNDWRRVGSGLQLT